MTTQHTPGPWLREGRTVYALMHHGWRRSVEQFRNRFWAHINKDPQCSEEEAEANAKLIAAAPEMLAALQALKAAGGIWPDLLPKVDAAIEKATKG